MRALLKSLFGRRKRNADNLNEDAFIQATGGPKKSANLGTDTLLTNWNPVALPFTRYTDKKHRAMVGRSRDVILNTTDGKTAARVIRHNVVGEMGVRLQSQVMGPDGKLDIAVNEAIEAAWKLYSETSDLCDIAGESTLYDFQVQMINSIVTDGEAFIRKHEVKDDYGLKLSLVDPLRIPAGRSSFIRPANDMQVYKNGIVLEKDTNKRLYYAVNKDDIYRYSDRIDDATYVPASQMLHAYLKEGFIGQMRGIPMGHTTFVNLYLTEKYIESAVVNARVSAAKLGWLSKSSDSDEKSPIVDFETDEEGNIIEDEDGNPIPIDPIANADISTNPGTVNWLPDGYNFQGWDTDYPHEQFGDFTKVANRRTASGFAVPYADMTGDLSDVNYSSIRQGALEIRENYKMLQKMIVWILDKIYFEWLINALMKGMIVVNGRILSVADIDTYYKPQWTPRRWPWIDPQAESRANQTAVQTGVRSVSQIIREMGGDPDETWKAIKQDIEKMKSYDIPEPIIYAIYAQKGAALENFLQELSNANTA